MAPIGKLYGLVSNPRVRRVLAVAKLAGVELETDSSFTMTQDWKTPEFLAKFPFGYLPAFEGKDGLKLQECAAIADYSGCRLGGFESSRAATPEVLG